MIIVKSFERGKIPTGMYQMGIFSTVVSYITDSKRKSIISKQKQYFCNDSCSFLVTITHILIT